MFVKDDYIIEISKLAKGSNEFDIEADRGLFEEFECEDAKGVNVRVKINAIKSEKFIEIDFDFKGEIEVDCCRCLSPMVLKVNKKRKLYVKNGDKTEEIDESEWIVDYNENKIDLTNYIYEELRLEIPIAPVHKHKEDCNQQMLERLDEINRQSEEDKENETDPRWAKLAELKSN